MVGGGFAGLSTAYHLAQRGAHVALLEAATLGAGASGRTGGLVLEGTAAGPLPEVEHCLEAISTVVRDAAIDCELELPGCVQVRHAAQPSGRGPDWRDGEQWIVAADLEPGGTVHPGKLVAGLAAAARAAGAVICESVSVQTIGSSHDGAYRLRCSPETEIDAAHVVLTVNAYTPQLVRLPPAFRAALTLALCTAPIDQAGIAALGLADRRPFYTLDLPYLWGRRLHDGRLILGVGLVFPADGDVRSVALEQSDSVEAMQRLESRVHRFHPALAEVPVTHRWGGPIAFRPGGAPILARLPEQPGVIVCGGCAGHGVALSIRLGQLIAAAVLDGATLPDWGALPE